jgi:hypothetical protein
MMNFIKYIFFGIFFPTLLYAQCIDTLLGKRESLGIYGGACHDFSFSNSGNRIFAGIKSPLSLIYTEDSGSTWHTVFPIDSLEYECLERGWGGGCTRILNNQKGWFLVQTSGDPVSASVVSFNHGDSGSWKTAIDPYLFNKAGYNAAAVQAIALSEYYLFTAGEKYIVKQDSTLKIDSLNITNVSSLIPGANSNLTIHVLALGSDSSGLPLYFAADTLGIENGLNKDLYKFDGDTVIKVYLPSILNGIEKVFTIPNQLNGDTVFICGTDTVNGHSKIFRSYDGGTSWKEIFNNSIATSIKDLDYSPIWKNLYSNSVGNILFARGDYHFISFDLGEKWDTLNGAIFDVAAISPIDTSLVIAANPMNSWSSFNGISVPFVLNQDYGFEAITINNISLAKDKSIVYVATNIGIAYTTAYNNTNIIGADKWTGLNGGFPLKLDTIINAEISCIKIDKEDSSHVIAGIVAGGIAITSSGPAGFTLLSPFDNAAEPLVKDIEFITSSIVLAVTNIKDISFTATGNIWRSTDGGYNWVKVSPTGFNCGNAIAVGYANNDTVIYVGSGFDIKESGYLWKSEDLGLTWAKVKEGPSAYLDSSAKNLPILDIAINPNHNDSIYLAAGSINNNYAFVWSPDGGLTYHFISVLANRTFNAVMVKKSSSDTILATNGREIFLYDVKNDTASIYFRGYPGELIPDLENGSILAGTTTGFYGILYDETADIILSDKLHENSVENKLQLFPNPASDNISIKMQILTPEKVSMEIFDVYGKLVKVETSMYNPNSETTNIDVKNLCNGTYFIKVRHGHQINYSKFILIKNL